MDLELTNIVNISVAEAGLGVGNFNTSNIGLFTREVPAGSFGTDGFALYVSPTQVGVDFGTNSVTYKMAVALFSQQPNILANGGYLAIILFAAGGTETQDITFSATPAFGAYKLQYNGTETPGFLDYNSTAADVQTELRLIAGLEGVTVAEINPLLRRVTMTGVVGDIALLTAPGSDNTLQDGSSAAITIAITETVSNETLNDAIVRTGGLVQYFGIMAAEVTTQAHMLDAAATVQSIVKMAAFVSRTAADVETGGMLDLLRSGGFNHSRGLFYGAATDLEALQMMAAYVGRAFSVNFQGSNTTQTMQLKDLKTIQPDPSMTQTLYTKIKAAGADGYASFRGVAKVFTSGKNKFFDQVYNLLWIIGDMQVNGFNALAQTSTKIPQTEQGIDVLKGAYRLSCEQGVANQYLAPGTWTSPNTFGNQADFLRNISERGYYIYSSPISQQSPAVRETRDAPLIQIALKEAGAVHGSNVLVNVNA